MANWLAQEADYGSTVVPLDDLIAHDNTGEDQDETCVCGPTWKPIDMGNGTIDWMLVHHSLDGRENTE